MTFCQSRLASKLTCFRLFFFFHPGPCYQRSVQQTAGVVVLSVEYCNWFNWFTVIGYCNWFTVVRREALVFLRSSVISWVGGVLKPTFLGRSKTYLT